MTNTRGISQTADRKKWWILGILAVLILAAAAFLAFQFGGPAVADYPAEVTVNQAATKREAGALILDVRQPEEWNEFHIPEATLIPLGELESRLSEVPRDREVVVVCRSGNRSTTGRDILRKAGYETVTSMAGGMNEWQAAGYPTVSGP